MNRSLLLAGFAAAVMMIHGMAAAQNAGGAAAAMQKQVQKGAVKHGGARPAPIKGMVREPTSQKPLTLHTRPGAVTGESR